MSESHSLHSHHHGVPGGGDNDDDRSRLPDPTTTERYYRSAPWSSTPVFPFSPSPAPSPLRAYYHHPYHKTLSRPPPQLPRTAAATRAIRFIRARAGQSHRPLVRPSRRSETTSTTAHAASIRDARNGATITGVIVADPGSPVGVRRGAPDERSPSPPPSRRRLHHEHEAIAPASTETGTSPSFHTRKTPIALRPHSIPVATTTKLQCLVLGAAGAGKTSLLRRFCYRSFEVGVRVPTVGSDFYTVTIPWPPPLSFFQPSPASTTLVARVESAPNGAMVVDTRHGTVTPPSRDHGDDRPTGASPRPPVTTACSTTTSPGRIRLQLWDTPGRERVGWHRSSAALAAASAGNHLDATFFRHADAIMLVYDMTSSTSFHQLLKGYSDLMEMMSRHPPIIVAPRRDNNDAPHGQDHDESRHPDEDWTSEWTIPIVVVANKLDLDPSKKQPLIGSPADPVPATGVEPPASNGSAPLPDNVTAAPVPRVVPRDVLGLAKHFKGNDFYYEYHVSSPVKSSGTFGADCASSSSWPSLPNTRSPSFVEDHPVPSRASHGHADGSTRRAMMAGPHHHHKASRKLSPSKNRRMEISSYLANRENWTTDGGYLESLLLTEEASHPDREMVQLWCLRNGLPYFEISAATGEGLEQAMHGMIRRALESRQYTRPSWTREGSCAPPLSPSPPPLQNLAVLPPPRLLPDETPPSVGSPYGDSDFRTRELWRQHEANHGVGTDRTVLAPTTIAYRKRNDALDLHQRYAPDDHCCRGFLGLAQLQQWCEGWWWSLPWNKFRPN